MVPIVEMFNHECMDVFYDFDYFENNEKTPADFKGLGESKKRDYNEILDETTSEESYNS